MGAPLAEEVRAFCITARTQNVTPLQCAEGFRFLNQLKNCNLSLRQIVPLIHKFYKMCTSANKDPKEIFSVCNEIFELQDPVPLAQLPEFISKLVERKKALESDISKLELAIKGLQHEFSELFKKVTVTRFDIERYKKIEQDFKKYDLTLQDLQKIVTIIENVNNIGSDPKKIVMALMEFKNCKQEIRILEEKIIYLKHAVNSAQQELQPVELELASRKKVLAQYNELKELKIDSEALKALKDIVHRSAEINSLGPEVAFRRFSDDILANYDVELGLEKKIKERTLELADTRQMLNSVKLECLKHQKECDIVDGILNHNSGLELANLIEISQIIKAFHIEYSQIVEELKNYGNLRNANIQLVGLNEKLESENTELSFENKTLKSEINVKSERVRSIYEHHKSIEQEFDRIMDQKTLECENKIKEIKNSYVVAKARCIRNISFLNAKEKQ